MIVYFVVDGVTREKKTKWRKTRKYLTLVGEGDADMDVE
jgi:hypothetical protein